MEDQLIREDGNCPKCGVPGTQVIDPVTKRILWVEGFHKCGISRVKKKHEIRRIRQLHEEGWLHDR